jgi:hypothetical protein
MNDLESRLKKAGIGDGTIFGIGVAGGIIVGAIAGSALGNVGLGVGLGICFGAALAVVAQRVLRQSRPEDESADSRPR